MVFTSSKKYINYGVVYDKGTLAIGLARVGQETQKIVAGKWRKKIFSKM